MRRLTCELPKKLLADKPQERADVEFQLFFGQVDPQFIQSPGEGGIYIPNHLCKGGRQMGKRSKCCRKESSY